MENLSIGKRPHIKIITFTEHVCKILIFYFISGEIYTSEKNGSDETGDGSEAKPFKTILQAMRHAGKEPFPTIYVDAKEEGKVYEVAAKSQLKKINKIWVRENYKAVDKAKAEDEGNDKRVQNLEEAKKIVIKEDPSLPKAKIVKISESEYCLLQYIYLIQEVTFTYDT